MSFSWLSKDTREMLEIERKNSPKSEIPHIFLIWSSNSRILGHPISHTVHARISRATAGFQFSCLQQALDTDKPCRARATRFLNPEPRQRSQGNARLWFQTESLLLIIFPASSSSLQILLSDCKHLILFLLSLISVGGEKCAGLKLQSGKNADMCLQSVSTALL